QIDQVDQQRLIKDVDWQEISGENIAVMFPDFWTYMVIRAERRNDVLRQKNKPQVDIPSPEAFALQKIREDGKKFSDEFNNDLPNTLVVSMADIKTHMTFLKIDWNSEVIQEWLNRHLLHDLDPEKEAKALPDWARFRLAYDLEKMAKDINDANKL
ncbi:MAG: hypothetical protein ACKPA7_17955, partial [Sphaerospermopsis kisseleviana]